MSARSARSRTPSRRAQEAMEASTLQTPPNSRGKVRSTALSIRKQAAATSTRRGRGRGGRGGAAASRTPTSASSEPPSAQQPRVTPSPSPPAPTPDPETPQRSIEDVLEDSRPEEESEEESEEAQLARFDFDVQIQLFVNGRKTVTLTQRFHSLQVFAAADSHRHRLLRDSKDCDVSLPPGPYTARLFLGTVNKHINTLFDDDCTLTDISADWKAFLLPFHRKALALEKARKAGAGEIVLLIEVPIKVEKKVVALESDQSLSDTSDSESHLDATQTRRKRKAQSSKRKRKGRETATQKMRRENRHDRESEVLANNHMRAIRDLHRCAAQACKNNGKFACIDVKLPGAYRGYAPGHVHLTDHWLRKWNDLIGDGKASVNDVPVGILDEASSERRRDIFTAPRVQNFYGPVSHAGGYEAHARVEHAEPPRSSPPQLTGDEDQNVIVYMEWLGQRNPLSCADFERFGGLLAEHGWGFSDLCDITEKDWEAMGIPAGFRRRIIKDLKTFARAQKARVEEVVEEEVNPIALV